MTDDDLIRRGDALKITRDRWAAHMEKAQRVRELDDQSAARETERLSHFAREADTIRLAIAALPAQGVRVRALEWADYEEIVRDAQSGMHYASRALNGFNAYFVMQDGEQFWWWTSGHQTDHSVAHPTFDAAKAAAQADYERRILAAIAPMDAAHVNEPPKSEHAAGNVLTDAALIARLREIQGQAGLFASTAADRIYNLGLLHDMAEARAERLEAALVEHNDLLRSALAIAKREGVEGQIASTNWDAYYNRVAVVLKRHHQTANEARATITEATDDPR